MEDNERAYYSSSKSIIKLKLDIFACWSLRFTAVFTVKKYTQVLKVVLDSSIKLSLFQKD